jgi:hypothetical protein
VPELYEGDSGAVLFLFAYLKMNCTLFVRNGILQMNLG